MDAYFAGCYSRLLAQAWCDEEFCGRLVADPRPVLARFGLDVLETTRLEIRLVDGEPDLRLQLARWRASGTCQFLTLDVPRVQGRHLSEIDLAAVVGGSAACACSWCGGGPISVRGRR